jgi:hypothetical protein
MSNLTDKRAKERMKEIKLQAKLDSVARKDLFMSAIMSEPLAVPQDIPAEEKIRRLGNVRGILRNMLFDLLKSTSDAEQVINRLVNRDEIAMYLIWPSIKRELEAIKIITPQMLLGVFEAKKEEAISKGLLNYEAEGILFPSENFDSFRMNEPIAEMKEEERDEEDDYGQYEEKFGSREPVFEEFQPTRYIRENQAKSIKDIEYQQQIRKDLDKLRHYEANKHFTVENIVDKAIANAGLVLESIANRRTDRTSDIIVARRMADLANEQAFYQANKEQRRDIYDNEEFFGNNKDFGDALKQAKNERVYLDELGNKEELQPVDVKAIRMNKNPAIEEATTNDELAESYRKLSMLLDNNQISREDYNKFSSRLRQIAVTASANRVELAEALIRDIDTIGQPSKKTIRIKSRKEASDISSKITKEEANEMALANFQRIHKLQERPIIRVEKDKTNPSSKAKLIFVPIRGKAYQRQFSYDGTEGDLNLKASEVLRKNLEKWGELFSVPSKAERVEETRRMLLEAQPLQKTARSKSAPRQTNPNTPGYATPSGRGIGRPRGKNPAKGKKITARKQKRVRYEVLPDGSVLYGKGVCKKSNLKKEKKIDYLEFGSKILSISQLEDEDTPVINLKYPNKTNIPTFPKREISKELACVVQNLIDTGSVNQRLYNSLQQNDKHLFNTILRVADLHSYIKEDSKDISKTLKNRFNVLVGEIEAGNDNPEIAREARQLIYQLTHSGMIQKHKSLEMLEELDKVMMNL